MLGSWLKGGSKRAQEAHVTKVGQWLLFILLTFLTTVLISYRGSKIPAEIKTGQIAPYDIKADRNYEIVDEEATAKFRTEAIQSVKPIYTFDPFRGTGVADLVKAAFDEMKRLLKGYAADFSNDPDNAKFADLSDAQLKDLKKIWEEIVGTSTGDKEWQYLLDHGFDDETVRKIGETVAAVMSHPIIDNREILLQEKDKGITVRKLPEAGEAQNAEDEDWKASEIDSAVTADDMKRDMVKGKYIPETLDIDDYDSRACIRIAADLVQSNMFYDAQETEIRRQNALKNIKSVVISIQTGEAIIRGGARFEPWHIKVIEGIRKEKSERSLPLEMVGSFILIFTIYLVVYRFGRKYIKKFAPTSVDLVFMGALMIVMLIMLRMSIFLASAIYGMAMTDIPRMALAYAIPIAAGAMLARFVINSETAAFFAIVLSTFAGIIVQGNLYYTSFALMSSLVAAFAISHADKRSTILQAGIITGFINAIIVLSIHLINAASVVEPLSINNIVWYEVTAFANGISCSVFVLVMAPLSESVFGYTTDIKLLELANLNHPLLRELIIRAPGTYHHSHLVGILAETAAESVGANALLARVGAYYHDIGKIRKPQYFTENMPENVSIHENLSPHMSALIIGSHVKEGLELAKTYKLPEVISAMIPEHHGVRKIGYFYEKAKESTDPSLQKIEEKDFRYPGPKPQSREAAILMLADGAEAAVRSLKEKTPTKIQQNVEGIIDKNFIEGQLGECELTLKDLNEIAKAFIKILTGIYHQRVEYPKEALERSVDEMSVFEEGKQNGSGGSNAPS